MKYVVLDIETSNLDMEAEGLTFGNPEGWNTACVSLYDIWQGEPYDSGMELHFVSDPDWLVSQDSNLENYSLDAVFE